MTEWTPACEVPGLCRGLGVRVTWPLSVTLVPVLLLPQCGRNYQPHLQMRKLRFGAGGDSAGREPGEDSQPGLNSKPKLVTPVPCWFRLARFSDFDNT